MKNALKTFIVLVTLTFTSNLAFAQEDKPVTDEELRRYAVAMDSVERMKQAIIEMMTEEVEKNEAITGKRFNELSRIIEDSVKLAEANATDEERTFILMVKEKKDKMTKNINTTFQSLAIDYLGEGGRNYKRIKSAIASDEEVKERYEDIFEDVSEDIEDNMEDADDANEDADDDNED